MATPGAMTFSTTLLFRPPVLHGERPGRGSDSLVALLESSTAEALDQGVYSENGRIMEDCARDRQSFRALRAAWIHQLENGTTMEAGDGSHGPLHTPVTGKRAIALGPLRPR